MAMVRQAVCTTGLTGAAKLVDQAQEIERWLRTGQSELSVSMQGVETVEGLGERIAAFLGAIQAINHLFA